MNRKIKAICISITSTMFFQGCSISSDNSSNHTLDTINLNNTANLDLEVTVSAGETSADEVDGSYLDIDVNEYDHTFVIHADNDVLDEDLSGTILTYSYPETANVYRVNYVEPEDPFYTPLTEWQPTLISLCSMLNCISICNADLSEVYRLSHSDVNSVVNSMTRLDSSTLEQMDVVESAYTNAEFSDYVVRSTFPAKSFNIYKVEYFDTIIDTIVDREFNYYVIRQSFDGIPYSVLPDTDARCEYFDDNNELFACITDILQWMYYDGTDIYEIRTLDQETEVYLENQTLLTFEQACELATPTINALLARYHTLGWDVQLYAAELVYAVTIESPFDFTNSTLDSFDWYLYPYWVVYEHINYVDIGVECAKHFPIYINAVTGEMHICIHC